MIGKNIDATAEELARIRALDDFDLKMLLSEINDFGWPIARTLLDKIQETQP